MASSSSYSGSALPAGSATNLTWQNIVDDISSVMGDATHDDSVVARMINMCVRDYSQHFPRVNTQTITTLLNDNQYNLNSDFMGVLSVEYPTGEDPPEYLGRMSQTHPDFWGSDYYYDIIKRADGTDQDEIVISKTDSAASLSIDVVYNAHHALIANVGSISGYTTMPHNHIHLLSLYVQWQSALELANAEQQSPTSNSSLIMAQLAQNARRAENAYHVALKQALYAVEGVSRTAQWFDTGNYRSKDASLARIY